MSFKKTRQRMNQKKSLRCTGLAVCRWSFQLFVSHASNMSESWNPFPTPALSYSQLLNTDCRFELIDSLADFHFWLNSRVSLCDNTTCKGSSVAQCNTMYHSPLCPVCKLCDSTYQTGLLFLTATLDAPANQTCHYKGNTLYLKSGCACSVCQLTHWLL